MKIAHECKGKKLWVKQFLRELGIKQNEYKINCNSQSALDRNSIYHFHMKHNIIRYHWIRKVMEEKQLLKLMKIHIDENLADMLTNVVTHEKLGLCQDIVGMDIN